MRKILTFCFAVIFTCGSAGAAQAFIRLPEADGAKTIRNDMGGSVLAYAMKAGDLARSGREVRFVGGCYSACTLYLSLPLSKTCVGPGASFGFHLPLSQPGRSNRLATKYLLSKYPAWVLSWLKSNGGLTGTLKIMDYNYASRFMPSCADAKVLPVSRRVSR